MANQVFLEKANRVEELVNYLYEEIPEFSSRYFLKGDTAINLLYEQKPRLSLDGDFNYSIPCSKDAMLKDREISNQLLIKIFSDCGYSVTKGRSNFGQDSFDLVYTTVKESIEKIKIELNYILRVPVDGHTVLPDTKIRTVGLYELFGAKLAALATRAKARDLFDLYYLITSNFISKLSMTKLKNCFIFYWALQKTEDDTPSFNNAYNISYMSYNSELIPCFLDEGIKPKLEEMCEILKFAEKQFLRLSDEQLQFIQGFRNNRNLTHLLFDKTIHHPQLASMDLTTKNNLRESDLFAEVDMGLSPLEKKHLREENPEQ